MPFLNLRLSGDPSPAVRQQAATLLTALTAEHLHKKPELTAVVVSAIPADHWFVGGTSLQTSGQSSFELEIHVTAGTNTEEQKAAYVQATFDALAALLGGRVTPVSYVVVHDVPADDWGYGGRTQASRRVAPAPDALKMM